MAGLGPPPIKGAVKSIERGKILNDHLNVEFGFFRNILLYCVK